MDISRRTPACILRGCTRRRQRHDRARYRGTWKHLAQVLQPAGGPWHIGAFTLHETPVNATHSPAHWPSICAPAPRPCGAAPRSSLRGRADRCRGAVLNPPEHALVLSCDEKSPIQALNPTAETGTGERAVRRQSQHRSQAGSAAGHATRWWTCGARPNRRASSTCSATRPQLMPPRAARPIARWMRWTT